LNTLKILKMKIISSTLILLILAMVFAPCGDSFEMDTSRQVEQLSKASIAGAVDIEYGMEKQQEECSPICPCQCCPSIASDIIDLSELVKISPIVHTARDKILISSVFSLLIWSPPQLFS